MRLIDADYITEGRVSNDPVVIAAKCAPTIHAIPVEWLEKQADFARSEWNYDTCEGIRIVLKAWQKEQEAR